MIIRSRRKSVRTFWDRLFGSGVLRNQNHILSKEDFALAVAKEQNRCDRRGRDRAFALLVLDIESIASSHKTLVRLCQDLRERVRITDEIGWRENDLCLLLPETDFEGAERVSKDVYEIAYSANLKIEVDILVYPDDDSIAFNSKELNPEVNIEDREEISDYIEHNQVLTDEDSIKRSVAVPLRKRAIDVFVALIVLVFFFPLLLLIGVLIKLDSKGPVFFRQQREGKDGRLFYILKFRTMKIDAEIQQASLRKEGNEQDGPAFKMTEDPRVTRIGKYLRKTCLDELPQMVNVLKGDMSLVGPRPLPVSESFASKIWHRRRLTVLPGLTCIWQVQGRRDISFDEWMRMDLEYIRKQSFWLDLKLLFLTAIKVVMHRGSV